VIPARDFITYGLINRERLKGTYTQTCTAKKKTDIKKASQNERERHPDRLKDTEKYRQKRNTEKCDAHDGKEVNRGGGGVREGGREKKRSGRDSRNENIVGVVAIYTTHAPFLPEICNGWLPSVLFVFLVHF
jgi:hypothetical protein